MKKLILFFYYFFICTSSYSQDTIFINPSTKLAKKILKRSEVYIIFQGRTKLSKIDYKTILCPVNKDFSWFEDPNISIYDSVIILQFVSYRNCGEIKIPVRWLKNGCEFNLNVIEYGKDWVSTTVKNGPRNFVNGFTYYKIWKFWRRNKC